MIGQMRIPSDAVTVEIHFSSDVSIKWPSVGQDDDAWDVWDSTHVRQGAHRIETVTRFTDAIESARALVRAKNNEGGA